jgi:hypothetical protein
VALDLARASTPARHRGRASHRKGATMSNADFVAFWVIATVIVWLAVCGLIWLCTEEWG